jgi:formylglycine-generating enzyme required for sulfatase activity
MVFDSRQRPVARDHRALVQLLKEKRAEAHFAGIQLDQTISVYDHAVPAHAKALQTLGLPISAVPMLCLVRLNNAGIPSQVIWKSTYDNPEVVLQALDQRLGIADRDKPKTPPILVLVGTPTHPGWLEAQAKLKTLLSQEWKTARIESFRSESSLPEVPSPGLALLDSSSRKILWKKGLTAPDSAFQSLGLRLGLVYKVPELLNWEKDGSILVRVSGGRVSIGSDDPQRPDDCKPRHTFDLEVPYYYMGKTEVTVAQFRRFVEATRYQTDAERAGRSFVFQSQGFTPVAGANWRTPKGPGSSSADAFPVVHITYADADAYAAWAGLRLPSEREWEHAAGSQNFPWGDQWNGTACRNSVGQGSGASGGPVAVGTYPQGASPWGCLDMAGNVYEWTSSLYLRYTDQSPPANSRMNGLRNVIRGGSFGNDEARDFWITARTAVGSQDSTEAQGFRVCLGGTRPQP